MVLIYSPETSYKEHLSLYRGMGTSVQSIHFNRDCVMCHLAFGGAARELNTCCQVPNSLQMIGGGPNCLLPCDRTLSKDPLFICAMRSYSCSV